MPKQSAERCVPTSQRETQTATGTETEPLSTNHRLGFILSSPLDRASLDAASAPPRLSYTLARPRRYRSSKTMAIAQVSLISAVKAAPTARVAKSAKARSAVVVAKAGKASKVEVAKKAAPVALSVGVSSPDDSLARGRSRDVPLERAPRVAIAIASRSRPIARGIGVAPRDSYPTNFSRRIPEGVRSDRAAIAPRAPREPPPRAVRRLTVPFPSLPSPVRAPPFSSLRRARDGRGPGRGRAGRGRHPGPLLRLPRLLARVRRGHLHRAHQDQAHLSDARGRFDRITNTAVVAAREEAAEVRPRLKRRRDESRRVRGRGGSVWRWGLKIFLIDSIDSRLATFAARSAPSIATTRADY